VEITVFVESLPQFCLFTPVNPVLKTLAQLFYTLRRICSTIKLRIMKNVIVSTFYRFLLVFALSITAILVYAQEQQQQPQQESSSSSSTTTTITKETTTTDWYTQPWVWVVGGAVFLIILIALLRGGSSRDTTVSRTTVVRDTP
jgi:drug/metabolite transporter (DMT)-like permease